MKEASLKSSAEIFYLDRPETANALDLPTAQNLKFTIKKAVQEKRAGLIITSKHPKVFCSGGDLKAYSKMKSSAQSLAQNKKIQALLSEFATAPLLIIAAVEGKAIGGGCELALACDRIICGEGAQFAFRQVGQGVTTGWGGGQRLLKRVGPPLALDWLISGRSIGPSEALRGGLVDQVVLKGQTLDAAQNFIARIDDTPRDLLGAFKKLAYAPDGSIHKVEETLFRKFWTQTH